MRPTSTLPVVSTTSTSCSMGRFSSSTSQSGPSTRATAIDERTRNVIASVSQSMAGRNSREPLSRSQTRSGPPWLVRSARNTEKRRVSPFGPVTSTSPRCLGMRNRSTARLIGCPGADLSLPGAADRAALRFSQRRHNVHSKCMCVKMVALLLLVAALPATAETRWIEGTLRGFPVVRDVDGHQIGEGTLTQYLEDGKLHAQGIFDLRDGRRVQEDVVLEQRPRLRQLSWSWEETRGGEVLRRFSVDLTTGHATARKRTSDGVDTWDDHLDGTRDGFAGVGFMYAVKNLTDRLDKGEKIELTAVVFTTKPRAVTVTVSRDQTGELTMGGRRLPAARYVIHPEVPWIARLFVKAPDQYLWYYRPDPPAFLRADIPVAEPGDPIIRIELLPGTESRAVGRAPRRHR